VRSMRNAWQPFQSVSITGSYKGRIYGENH
jgi:hypothetical protein